MKAIFSQESIMHKLTGEKQRPFLHPKHYEESNGEKQKPFFVSMYNVAHV